MKLNLGCSDRHLPGYVNCDIAPPADQIVDLAAYRYHFCGEQIQLTPRGILRGFIAAIKYLCTVGLPGTWIEKRYADWPWPPSSAEEVVAFDLIEHIPNRIHFMNQLHRVLKPGARAIIETPDAAKGPGFWQDPTHQAGWTLNSFQYFEQGSFAHKRLAKSYGITAAFRIVSLTETQVPDVVEPVMKITAVLEAIK